MESFVFHREWADELKAMEIEHGKQYAREAALALVMTAISGQSTSANADINDWINNRCMPIIESDRARYKAR